MFYELCITTKGDFANFVDDGCWNCQVDEFAEYMAKQK